MKAPGDFPGDVVCSNAVLLETGEWWSHLIAAVCSEIKRRFINICAYFPSHPPGVWKRQLRETDALSHALFTALIPQPYKTENRGVCVYFIYLSNPQIDSCKMFLVKDSWPGIKWWSFALKGSGPISVFLFHQKSQKIDTALMSCTQLEPGRD